MMMRFPYSSYLYLSPGLLTCSKDSGTEEPFTFTLHFLGAHFHDVNICQQDDLTYNNLFFKEALHKLMKSADCIGVLSSVMDRLEPFTR